MRKAVQGFTFVLAVVALFAVAAPRASAWSACSPVATAINYAVQGIDCRAAGDSVASKIASLATKIPREIRNSLEALKQDITRMARDRVSAACEKAKQCTARVSSCSTMISDLSPFVSCVVNAFR